MTYNDRMQKVSAAVLALCAAVAAQDLPAKARSHGKETAHLTVTTSASQDAVAPGKRVSLQVDVVPKPKMHVYSPGQDGYIAITLTLAADPAFIAARAKYPAGEKLYMPVLKETQLVYSKPFRIVQEMTLASTHGMRQRALRLRSGQAVAEEASLTITGTLRYQACDDTICYLPVNVPLAWTMKLAALQ